MAFISVCNASISIRRGETFNFSFIKKKKPLKGKIFFKSLDTGLLEMQSSSVDRPESSTSRSAIDIRKRAPVKLNNLQAKPANFTKGIISPVRSGTKPILGSKYPTQKNTTISQFVNRQKSSPPRHKGYSPDKWMGSDNNDDEDPVYSDDESEQLEEDASIDRAFEQRDEPQVEDENQGEDDDEWVVPAKNKHEQSSSALEFPSMNNTDAKSALIRYGILRDRWLLPNQDKILTDIERSIQLARNFKINLDDIVDVELEENFRTHQCDIEIIMVAIQTHAVEIGEQSNLILFNMSKILKQCSATYEFLLAMIASKRALVRDELQNDHMLRDRTLNRNLDGKQKFIEFLYKNAAQRGYRKYGGSLYEPIYTKVGNHYTHAYKESITIEEFVRLRCHRDLMPEYYSYITQARRNTKQQIKDISETLELLIDPQLPDLKRDRHKFAFKNGILVTKVMYGTGKRRKDDTPVQRVRHQFFLYGSEEITHVDQTLVAAKYFDMTFNSYPDEDDWWTIPSAALEHTIKYQYEDREDYEEISRFMYMNIGRLLFSLGDLDNWQYMVHIIGVAGTGKSLVVDMTKQFYESPNRVEIDNSIEKQFGLGGLLVDMTGKQRELYITTSSEIASNCQLDKAMMLKMIAGDELALAVKFRVTSITTRWPTHWISVENEFPATWKDTAGQTTRRMLIFEYLKSVFSQKTDLKEQVAAEIPNIILKSIRAYHHYVNKYGNCSDRPRGLTDFEPKYFKETREALANVTNHMRAFVVESGRLTISPRLVLSEDDFITEYRDYCRTRGIHSHISNPKIIFSTIIAQLRNNKHNVQWEERSEFYYEGKQHWPKANYFLGLGLSARLTDNDKEEIHAARMRQDEETAKAEEEDNRMVREVMGIKEEEEVEEDDMIPEKEKEEEDDDGLSEHEKYEKREKREKHENDEEVEDQDEEVEDEEAQEE